MNMDIELDFVKLTKEECINKLQNYLDQDQDNMNVENFYKNIESSSGSIKELAGLFSVDENLIENIQRLK